MLPCLLARVARALYWILRLDFPYRLFSSYGSLGGGSEGGREGASLNRAALGAMTSDHDLGSELLKGRRALSGMTWSERGKRKQHDCTTFGGGVGRRKVRGRGAAAHA